MSVLNRDEFISRVTERIGDDTNDDALAFIEDLTDTFDELSSKANNDEWEKKYNDLDTMWREKYKSRFMKPLTTPDDDIIEQKEDETEVTFDDLFEEREA